MIGCSDSTIRKVSVTERFEMHHFVSAWNIIHTHIHTDIYTYIHPHIHTYTHTNNTTVTGKTESGLDK
jgi:hypothetical protein